MSEADKEENEGEAGVSHIKEEVTILDFERVAAVVVPHAEAIVKAYHSGLAETARVSAGADVEKARIAENGATTRHKWITWMLCAVVALLSSLAAYALHAGEPGVAEKIIIALFAFLGGFASGRR